MGWKNYEGAFGNSMWRADAAVYGGGQDWKIKEPSGGGLPMIVFGFRDLV
jgi:hypothetical protein